MLRITLLFQLIFTYPIWLTLICLLAGIAFAFLLYYKADRNKERSKSVNRILLALRIIFVSLVAFFLLEPLLKNVSVEKEKPVLLLAVDNSMSVVQNADSAFLKKEFLEGLHTLADEVKEKFDVKFYNFDHELRNGDTINFKGKETDFTSLFNEIENNYSNRNLGALVLATDGLYNKGINPLYANKNLKYPVFTLALGDTTEKKDLLIKKINHNQVAYLGNKFPAEIIIEGKKVKGTKGTLSVYNGTKKLAEERFEINSESYLKTFSFIFDADKPGAQKYNAFVSYAEGEQNKLNNSSSFVVDVIDNREKILILAAAPHPDIAAIKQGLEVNQNYEVISALANEFNAPLKQYSTVIVHMLPWNSSSRIKNEIESNNIPCLLISGETSDNFPALKISGPQGKTNEAEASLSRNFSLFSVSEELKNYARNFPAVRAPLGNYSPGNDLNALFNQRIGIVQTENPLLYFTFNSQQKCGVFLGDGIWRWRLRDFQDHGNFNLFNELIGKTVQYLSVKEDKSFFRVFSKKIFSENEEVEMDAEVYNQSYELVNTEDVTVKITNEQGKSFDYTFSKTMKSYKLSGISFPPGEYSWDARVKLNNNLMSKKGSFTVKELVAERVNTVADHQLLFNLSKQSGGRLYYPAQLKEMTKELLAKEDIKTVSYEEKKLLDLIEIKWLFFILLAFVSAEWFIRKWSGLY